MREIKFQVIIGNKIVGIERLVNGAWEWMHYELNSDSGERWTPGVFGNTMQLVRRQYTGLKDKSGKEIYDGDLIQHLDETLKVFFNESMGSWDLEYEGGDSINLVDEDGWDTEDFEVIGNIYETK